MVKLRTSIEDLTLRHRFTIARDSQDISRVVFAEFEHDGIIGWGEASPTPFYGETAESVEQDLLELRPWLARCDPRAWRHLLAEAAGYLEGRRGALCALDLAVHDWAARSIGRSLWELWGLDPRRMPLSSFTIGIDTPEVMVAKLREAPGFPIYKIKVGTPGDIDILRRLRRETDAVFRIDANCGWTAEECIENSRELKALGVEFIEQPLPPDQLDAMEEVCARSALPIVADESSEVPEDVPKLVGRFDGINIKLIKCGGLAPALRMVETARTLGLKVMIGCMIESSVLITAAAQMGAMVDWLDLDGNILITDDPFVGVTNDHGRLTLPDGPVRRRPD